MIEKEFLHAILLTAKQLRLQIAGRLHCSAGNNHLKIAIEIYIHHSSVLNILDSRERTHTYRSTLAQRIRKMTGWIEHNVLHR